MPEKIDISKILNDPSISPEMRAFAEKLKAFAALGKSKKEKFPAPRHRFYTKLEEYYLEVEFTCLCCSNKWKTMFFMADQGDGTLRGEGSEQSSQGSFLFGDNKPKSFKTKRSGVFTCQDCTSRLSQLSKEELVKRHLEYFASMVSRPKSMPRKKKFVLRHIDNEKEKEKEN